MLGGLTAARWIAERVTELNNMAQVVLLPRTTVTGYYDNNFLVANERVTEHLGPNKGDKEPKERLWKIRAKQVVLATGSIERPLVFADNDRPGVMLAGAVRIYINRFGVLPGKRIVVLTNNDSAYYTALDAKHAGAEVEVVDIRPARRSGRTRRPSPRAGHSHPRQPHHLRGGLRPRKNQRGHSHGIITGRRRGMRRGAKHSMRHGRGVRRLDAHGAPVQSGQRRARVLRAAALFSSRHADRRARPASSAPVPAGVPRVWPNA